MVFVPNVYHSWNEYWLLVKICEIGTTKWFFEILSHDNCFCSVVFHHWNQTSIQQANPQGWSKFRRSILQTCIHPCDFTYQLKVFDCSFDCNITKCYVFVVARLFILCHGFTAQRRSSRVNLNARFLCLCSVLYSTHVTVVGITAELQATTMTTLTTATGIYLHVHDIGYYDTTLLLFLTLGSHAHKGYSSHHVCLFVCPHSSASWRRACNKLNLYHQVNQPPKGFNWLISLKCFLSPSYRLFLFPHGQVGHLQFIEVATSLVRLTTFPTSVGSR